MHHFSSLGFKLCEKKLGKHYRLFSYCAGSPCIKTKEPHSAYERWNWALTYLQVILPQDSPEWVRSLMLLKSLRSQSLSHGLTSWLLATDLSKAHKSILSLFSPCLNKIKDPLGCFLVLFSAISLDLFLVEVTFLNCLLFLLSSCCWVGVFLHSNSDPITISSIVPLSCEFMFLTWEDGWFPGRLNVKPGCFVVYLWPSCFHSMVFCIQKWMCRQQRNKDGYLFPESSMHGSYVNMFLVTLTLLLRQLFLT